MRRKSAITWRRERRVVFVTNRSGSPASRRRATAENSQPYRGIPCIDDTSEIQEDASHRR